MNDSFIVPIGSWTTWTVVATARPDTVFTANFVASSVKVVVWAMMCFRVLSDAPKSAERDSWIVMAPVVCLAQGFLMLAIVNATSCVAVLGFELGTLVQPRNTKVLVALY